MMKRIVLFALLALTLLVTNTAYAQKTFFWESFDVDVRLRDDGTLDVTEQQTLVFGGDDFTFGFATIPFNNLDDINNITVREGDTVFRQVGIGGTPNTFTIEERSDEIEINWYFAPTQGRHTYTFSYTVDGAVRVEETGSQVFWTAIPSDIPGQVRESKVTIFVPPNVTILSTTALVNGQEGSAGSTIADDQRSATFSTVNIFPGDTFEIGARFPAEQLDLAVSAWQQREALGDTFGLFILFGSLGLLIGGPLVVLGLWYTRGRDPEAAFSAEYITTPPDNTPPAIVGSLVDEKADMRDILSTIVDLARRGHIHIKEEERDHTYTRRQNNDDELRPFERGLLSALFDKSDSRKLSELKYKFSTKLPSLRQSLYNELVGNEYFRRSPETTRNRYRGVGAVMTFFAFVAMFGIGAVLASIDTAFCLGMALIPSGLLMLYVATHMPRKTQAGAEAAAQWEAFRNYLRNIEKYDGLKEANEVFDKYLPYAVAFGFERSWIQKFERLPQPVAPPIWYDPYPRRYRRGGYFGGFGGAGRSSTPSTGGGASMPTLEGMSESMTGGLEGMSQSFTRMLNSTATTMKSVQPSSNNSSGSFGGGGFSGGFSGGSSGGGSRGFG